MSLGKLGLAARQTYAPLILYIAKPKGVEPGNKLDPFHLGLTFFQA